MHRSCSCFEACGQLTKSDKARELSTPIGAKSDAHRLAFMRGASVPRQYMRYKVDVGRFDLDIHDASINREKEPAPREEGLNECEASGRNAS